MKKIYIAILFIFNISVFSQNTKKTYILHLSGKAQDTMVYEMELNNDNTFVDRSILSFSTKMQNICFFRILRKYRDIENE